MRTDRVRTDEVYPVAFDSIPHHCQDSELQTGEHISRRPLSLLRSWYLTLHRAAGTRAVRARAGLRPLMGPGRRPLGPMYSGYARSGRREPRSPTAAGVLGLLGLGVSFESRHALVPTLAPGVAHGSGSKELPRQPLPAAVRSCYHGGK